jgi:hypothetical protein
LVILNFKSVDRSDSCPLRITISAHCLPPVGIFRAPIRPTPLFAPHLITIILITTNTIIMESYLSTRQAKPKLSTRRHQKKVSSTSFSSTSSYERNAQDAESTCSGDSDSTSDEEEDESPPGPAREHVVVMERQPEFQRRNHTLTHQHDQWQAYRPAEGHALPKEQRTEAHTGSQSSEGEAACARRESLYQPLVTRTECI